MAAKYIPDRSYNVPIGALHSDTKKKICLAMNLRREVSHNDWIMLAEEIGCSIAEIDTIKRNNRNFTDEVMRFASDQGYSVGRFLKVLFDIERIDVLEECKRMIENDVAKYQPVQEPIVTSASRPCAPLTAGEVKTGKPEQFDAVVLFHPKDVQFLHELEDKLEKRSDFRLCIPERDCLPGIVKCQVTAELIGKRCRRIIIVISMNFIKDPEKYALYLALSMAPVADDMHKLLPVCIDPAVNIHSDLPDVLRPYNICETNSRWFWDKLKQSLRTTTNGRHQ